ncbi:MAG: hypothetical protein M3Q06_11315 [Bacteroidota bacterium]|nr:hypothetical protein [Bacteroidota bacterium]
MNRNEDNNKEQASQNDPSNAMNSKREVANSPDNKIDEDFPGYPHYPSNEDIMDASTGSHRVDVDVEEMGTGPNKSGVSTRYMGGRTSGDAQNRDAEGEENSEGTTGLDGQNEEFGTPHNVSNEDLDRSNAVPGTDIDEAAEKGSLNP